MAPNTCENIFVNFINTLHIIKILDTKFCSRVINEFIQILQAVAEELSIPSLNGKLSCTIPSM